MVATAESECTMCISKLSMLEDMDPEDVYTRLRVPRMLVSNDANDVVTEGLYVKGYGWLLFPVSSESSKWERFLHWKQVYEQTNGPIE